MYDPTSALPVEELLGAERAAAPEGFRLSLDESTLIDRAVAGDDTAFDQIVLRYQDMVFSLATRLLGSYDEAVDLSQEVFLQVYRKLSSFRRDASLRTWIYRIVINRAKNRRRWWKRRITEMTALPIGKGELRRESTAPAGRRIALLAFGTMVTPALAAAELCDMTVANMRFVKPLDAELVRRLAATPDGHERAGAP